MNLYKQLGKKKAAGYLLPPHFASYAAYALISREAIVEVHQCCLPIVSYHSNQC